MSPRSRRIKVISEINVTPFVDVMLVLLIIFMVTAPLLNQGIDVDLPKTQSAGLRENDDALVVTVKRDGTLYVQRAKVGMKEFEGKIEQIFASRGNRDVFLRADDQVAYGTVAKTLAALRRAGAARIGMVTQPDA